MFLILTLRLDFGPDRGGIEGRISRDHDYRVDQSSCPDLTQDIDSRPVPQNDVCKYHIKACLVYSGQSFAAI